MERYAQTNLQLFNQMMGAGYNDRSLSLVARGYDLAMELFSGRYRANGKPFLAHLVGTASILAAQKLPVEVVVAGLLHAAYAQGAFNHQPHGLTSKKRTYVKQAVGDEVESLIAEYTRLPWTVDNIVALRDRLPTLPEAERNLVIMRLANELEDYADLGMGFCQKNREHMQTEWNAILGLARGLGYTHLEEQLAESFHANATCSIPAILCRTEEVSFNYGLPHPSRVSRVGLRAIVKQLLPVPVLKTLKGVLNAI